MKLIIASWRMPWASTSEISFLFKEAEMDNFLTKFGLTKEQSNDQTQN